jgi:membrane associated rhomboid family serine protease
MAGGRVTSAFLLFCLAYPLPSASKQLSHNRAILGNSYVTPRVVRRSVDIRNIRGGGGVSNHKDEDVDDDDDDDEVGEVESDIDDGDFEGENSIKRRVKNIIEKTPPITQGFLSLSLLITVLSYLFNNNEFPTFLLLNWGKVIKNGEYWRLLTSFLCFGPLDISYLLTLQFIWQYMSQLEKVHHKHPEEVHPLCLFIL